MSQIAELAPLATFAEMRLRARRALALARLAFASDVSVPRAAIADAAGICEVLAPLPMIDAIEIARLADRRLAQHIRAARALRGRDLASWLAGCAAQPAGLEALLDALAHGPVVLAVPLHASVLAFLGRFLLTDRVPTSGGETAVFVQQTPLTEVALSATQGTMANGWHLHSERELVAQAKVKPAPSRLWLTFPDHAAAPVGARHSVTLCGQLHYYGMLELALVARLGAPIWTLDTNAEHASALRLRSCEWTPGVRSTIDPGEASRLYDDIANAQGRVLCQSPADVLSWGRIARNRESVIRGRQLRAIATMRELLVAWSQAATDASPPLHLSPALTALERSIRTTSRAGQSQQNGSG